MAVAVNYVLITVFTAVWAMVPAYIPNNAAVLFAGERPLDRGRSWRGERLLGDGKTVRGTAGGFLAGFVAAHLLNGLAPYYAPGFTFAASISLPLGALAGDVAASFVKRRTGRERGEAWPGVDQYDFVLGAWVLALVAAPDWFLSVFTPPVIAAVLVVTPALHLTTNFLAYKLDLKNEPW